VSDLEVEGGAAYDEIRKDNPGWLRREDLPTDGDFGLGLNVGWLADCRSRGLRNRLTALAAKRAKSKITLPRLKFMDGE
jgi:hypothetical protein